MNPSTPLLRPALELALAVARDAEGSRPPLAVPGALRPLLRFSRLQGRALDTVRQVVEEDADFREQVAAVADEAVLGRAPWLWLVRPPGWTDEMASVAAESHSRAQLETDRRADRLAERRLRGVEAALRRTEADLQESRAAAAALTSELVGVRLQLARAERRLEAEAVAMQARAEAERSQAEAARSQAETARSQTEAARSEAERRAAAAEGRETELQHRLTEAQQRLAEAQQRLAVSEAANGQLEAALVGRQAVAGTRRDDDERRAATSTALRQAVAEAASAAASLGTALARAAEVLGERPEAGSTAPLQLEPLQLEPLPVGPLPLGPLPLDPVPAPASLSGTKAEGGKRGPGVLGGGGPRRRPVPLPRAVFDDSVEAAAWLLRLPGAVLLVDGYNVTLRTWAGRDLPDQRHRLVTALAELSMRTGAQIEVVFDGADDHAYLLRSLPARRAVRVAFSPPGVDADELIIERVAGLRASRPVIVATDDRRVRDESAGAGANLISTEQLVAVLGRGRDSWRT